VLGCRDVSTVGKVEAGIAAATAQDTAKCLQGASRFRSVCAWSSRARLKFPASIALTSKERSLTKRLTRGESPGKVWSAHEIERGKTFAQFERRLISQRTRAALARTRAQGVRLGRPPTMSPMRSTGSGPSEQPATASRRSRTDSTRIASPPRRAAEERRVSNVNYLFWVAPSS